MTVDALGQRVIDILGIPKDSWEIAAQLEVLGMRDADARAAYGMRDLFELAAAIDHRFRNGSYSFFVEGEDPQPRVIPLFRFIRRYFAGITFAMPMALQAASMLAFGYGIWGAVDLELVQGSGIALGFIASYVVAGGFIQAIVRRGLFYIYQKEEGLARWTALRGFAIAIRTMIVLLLPALLLNAFFKILPWSMVIVAAGFYAGLGVLWLTWALIYLVRKTHLFLTITAISLAVVVASAKIGGVPPIAANAIGVATAAALSFAVAYRSLGRLAARTPGEPVNPPRIAVLVYSTSRYFVYGFLFNAFLFADRVIAWTTPVGREDFPPYPFWLSVRYELALDLALIVALVMSGVVEFALERFSEELIPHEKATKFSGAAGSQPAEASGAPQSFIAEQLRMHRRRSIELGVAAVIGLAIAWGVVVLLRDVPNVRLHEALTADVTMRVFAAAAFAYVVFMFAVRNLLLLLTLSRVDEAMRSVAIALGVNVVAGFLCSRALHYAAAVVGLVAGSLVLAFFARRAVRRVLARLDYYYYAAY